MQHIVHFFKACLRLISNAESNYEMPQYYHQVEMAFQLTNRLLIGRSICKELTKSRRVPYECRNERVVFDYICFWVHSANSLLEGSLFVTH